jgi:hypothetical protein
MKKMNRILFLGSLLLLVLTCAAAYKLLHAHPDSDRAHLAVQFGLILAGVVWLRSLESRLADAGLPRWSFWPYFLAVFISCFGAHALKFANSLETLALFLLFQLPALLFAGTAAPAAHPVKPARPVTPIDALHFAWFLFLLVNLLQVAHLLRGDVGAMAHGRFLRFALDACALLLLLPWFFSLRARLSALDHARWALPWSAIILLICLPLNFFHLVAFTWALLLFAALQLPLVLIRRAWIPARFRPEDSGF